MWLNKKEIPEDTGFWDIIRQSGPEYQPCILCGEDSRDRGYFKPENPQQFGAPEGKTRIIFYPVCLRCWKIEGAFDQITKIIYLRYKAAEALKN